MYIGIADMMPPCGAKSIIDPRLNLRFCGSILPWGEGIIVPAPVTRNQAHEQHEMMQLR